MNNIFQFPKKKANKMALIEASDFEILLNKLNKNTRSLGRSEGFFLGSSFATIVNIAVQLILPHM